MAEMKVQIGAEIKDFQTKLAQALKGLDDLKREEKELSKAYKDGKISADNYYKAVASNAVKLQKASSTVSKYKNSINSADKSVVNLGKGASNAVPSLTSFSQVIQDAPYGIQGVANNITQLTSQFGYLSKSAGGSGAALKQMLKTLAGPAGILLGVSVLTSLLVSFGDKLSLVNDKTKEFRDTLEGISSSAIVEFKVLTDTILDVNASQREQAKAIDILKEKYSSFDSSILTNVSNYGKAKKAVEAYIVTLVQQARAKAALTLIEEKQSKIIALEEKKMLKMRKSFNAATIEQFEQRRKKLLELNNKQLKDNEDLRLKREKQINDRFDTVKNMGASEINALKDQISVLSNLANIRNQVLFGDVTKKEPSDRSAAKFIEVAKKDWLTQVSSLNGFIKENPIELVNTEKFDQDAFDFKMKLAAFSQSIGQTINDAGGQLFSGFGKAIGDSLASGGDIVQSMGKVLLSTLGNLLVQVGNMAIGIGLSLQAIKVALKSLNPAVAIAAGVGLVALGSFFSSKSNAIGDSMGSSGGASSNIGTGTGSNTYSSYGGSSSYASNGSGNVVFEVQGNKLVGVLNNTLRQNKSLAGTLSLG